MRLRVTGQCVLAARCARPSTLAARHAIGYQKTRHTRRVSSQAAEQVEEDYPSSPIFSENRTSSVAAASSQASLPQGQPHHEDAKRILKLRNESNKIITTGDWSGILISDKPYIFDKTTNMSSTIASHLNRRLYDTPDHPICITRKLIESVFASPTYKNHIASNPVATTRDNFDVLGFPQDHPGRSRTDTYYVNAEHVLRTHTSAHQHAAFEYMSRNPEMGYTICADVFRRDSIDRSHFPVFHQMEGARMWQYEENPVEKESRFEMHMNRTSRIYRETKKLRTQNLDVVDREKAFDVKTNPRQLQHDEDLVRALALHLKLSLEYLVEKIFDAALGSRTDFAPGPREQLKVRWVEAYFPFTSPSWELEVFWQGEWLELLGCGIVQQKIVDHAGLKDSVGWAWGLGIERLAMLLFDIPDIRLFWSEDERFLKQFAAGKIKKYEPFSKYPACYKDVAFWINPSPSSASPVAAKSADGTAAAAGGDARKASPSESQPAAFHENDIMEIVRDVAGTLAEDVKIVDEFVHPTTGRKSLCYRINYRSLERTLTNEEVNKMHEEVTERLKQDLGIEIR